MNFAKTPSSQMFVWVVEISAEIGKCRFTRITYIKLDFCITFGVNMFWTHAPRVRRQFIIYGCCDSAQHTGVMSCLRVSGIIKSCSYRSFGAKSNSSYACKKRVMGGYSLFYEWVMMKKKAAERDHERADPLARGDA